CSNDEPDYGSEGGPRDWRYPADRSAVYIDGVEQTQVSEVWVRSSLVSNEDNNPRYYSELIITGLEKKNKTISVYVDSDLDTFSGHTRFGGHVYDVTGEFTGNPFEHYTNMGIIIRLKTIR
ncbi:MAG: hypothetical protein K2F63_07060, partial [Muribaculaceae bacterium]|nr:hypothetical protein [Muribaculaceae bacterium]